MWVKQSTAVTVVLGPFVDSTDGNTPETTLTLTQPDIRLSKNGGAFAQTNNAAGATHMENGHYSVPLNTTDTNTLGTLRVAVNESGALPVWRDLMVVPANVWDSFFGADKLQVHADEITNNLITAAAINDGAIDAATFAAGALGAVWDEARSSHVAAGTFGQTLQVVRTGTAQAGGATSITLDAGASATNDFYRNALVSILSGTGAGQTRRITAYVGATKVATVDAWATNPDNTSVFAISGADAVTVAAMNTDVITAAAIHSGAVTEIQSGLATQASVDTIDDFLDTEVAAILADTNELQTDWANGGRLDNILDARASQASVDDLPTNAELATALAAADDAVLAAVAGLNDLSATEVENAVWDAVMANHLDAGSTGASLNGAGSAGDPWTTPLPGAYGAGTAGFIVGTNLNATVGSRSSHSAADVWAVATRTLTAQSDSAGVTTLLSRLTAGRATNLDNLDAAISSRSSHAAADIWAVGARTITGGTITTVNDKTGYSLATAPPTAAQVAAEIIATALSELTAAEPADAPTVGQALMLPYHIVAQGGTFNKDTGVSTYKNGAGTVILKRTLSDDGTTLTEGKLVAGP